MRSVVSSCLMLMLILSGCALRAAENPVEEGSMNLGANSTAEGPTAEEDVSTSALHTAESPTAERHYDGGDYDETISVDGRQRSYILHVPPAVNPQDPLPLIIVLHGGGGQSRTVQRRLGFDAYADERGFYVAYPESYQGMRWNDGRSTVDSLEANVDDVGFILAMIDEIAGEISLDRSRIYVTGVSNGGMLTYRLGCETSGVFAGIAPVIANIPVPIAETCTPQAPLDVLAINGDADPLIPIEGGEVCHEVRVGCEKGFVISMSDSVATFAAINACGLEPRSETLPAPVNDGTYAEWRAYPDCRDNARVQAYVVHNAGHTWPPLPAQLPVAGQSTGNLDATETIVDFFVP